MGSYFFTRQPIRKKDGRFWLVIGINEEVRPGVFRRKSMIEVGYDRQAAAEEAKVKWTDARLRRLSACF